MIFTSRAILRYSEITVDSSFLLSGSLFGDFGVFKDGCIYVSGLFGLSMRVATAAQQFGFSVVRVFMLVEGFDGRAGSCDGFSGSCDGRAGSCDGRAGSYDGFSGSCDGHAGSCDGRAGSCDGFSSSCDNCASSCDGDDNCVPMKHSTYLSLVLLIRHKVDDPGDFHQSIYILVISAFSSESSPSQWEAVTDVYLGTLYRDYRTSLFGI